MKVLITGPGRGGTNLLTELVRASGKFNFTQNIEDRSFFSYHELPDKYATKLATENHGFNEENLTRILNVNEDLMLLFSVRHPIDNCLSKIVRGQGCNKGGDNATNQPAPDSTIEGSVEAVKYMHRMYNFLKEEYPEQVELVRMEDLIRNMSEEIKRVSKFLDIVPNRDMAYFFQNNRNVYQKARYGKQLASQVDLYKNLDDNFDGFFKATSWSNITQELATKIKEVSEEFGYVNEL